MIDFVPTPNVILKRCPFCGATVALHYDQTEHSQGYFISCFNPRCHMLVSTGSRVQNKADVIKLWNTRYTDEPTKQEEIDDARRT